jgi:hypothetical protein
MTAGKPELIHAEIITGLLKLSCVKYLAPTPAHRLSKLSLYKLDIVIVVVIQPSELKRERVRTQNVISMSIIV